MQSWASFVSTGVMSGGISPKLIDPIPPVFWWEVADLNGKSLTTLGKKELKPSVKQYW